MSVLFITMIWRVWLFGTFLLAANSLARFVFNMNRAEGKRLACAIPLIAVWPLALFAPKGRAVLFKRLKKL